MTTTTKSGYRQAPAAGRYTIDPAASNIGFTTRHLFGLASVRGTFAITSGVISVREPIDGSSVHVEIDAASFRTRSRRRDMAIRDARFLDSAQYPTITFRSASVDLDEAGGTVAGELTVRGVTRPVTLGLSSWDVLVSEGGARAVRAHAATRVDRRAFGVAASRGLVSRHLEIAVHITCSSR